MAGAVPDLLTVEEAARLIRVGRTKAYAMATEWRATGGRSGLPVVDFGHVLRVPRHALEELIGAPLGGDIVMAAVGSGRDDTDARSCPTCPALQADAPPEPEPRTPRSDRPSRPRSASSRRASGRPSNQLDLFELPPSTPRP